MNWLDRYLERNVVVRDLKIALILATILNLAVPFTLYFFASPEGSDFPIWRSIGNWSSALATFCCYLFLRDKDRGNVEGNAT